MLFCGVIDSLLSSSGEYWRLEIANKRINIWSTVTGILPPRKWWVGGNIWVVIYGLKWDPWVGHKYACFMCCGQAGPLLTWTFVSLIRSHCEGSEHWDFTPASRGIVWARRLLVPVCGLEFSRHYEESEGVCAHCLWVIACGHAWVQIDGNALKLRQCLIWHQKTLVSIPIPKLSLEFCIWNIVPLKSPQFFSFKILRNSLSFRMFLDLVAIRLWENQVLSFILSLICLFV